MVATDLRGPGSRWDRPRERVAPLELSMQEHSWVYQNMLEADEIAQGFPPHERTTVYLEEFGAAVVNVVVADPTIVRAAYWKCRDYYRRR
jgi:hypothetical protein